MFIIEGNIEKIIADFEPLRKSLCRRFSYLGPEDLDQDLILLILENLENYEKDQSNLPYYIKKICTWYCLDRAKAHKNTLSLEEKDEEGLELKEKIPSNQSTEEIFSDEERRYYIRRKVENLEEIERYVIVGHYFENVSLKNLGENLGLSPATISRIHKRALRKLRKEFINM